MRSFSILTLVIFLAAFATTSARPAADTFLDIRVTPEPLSATPNLLMLKKKQEPQLVTFVREMIIHHPVKEVREELLYRMRKGDCHIVIRQGYMSRSALGCCGAGFTTFSSHIEGGAKPAPIMVLYEEFLVLPTTPLYKQIAMYHEFIHLKQRWRTGRADGRFPWERPKTPLKELARGLFEIEYEAHLLGVLAAKQQGLSTRDPWFQIYLSGGKTGLAAWVALNLSKDPELAPASDVLYKLASEIK